MPTDYRSLRRAVSVLSVFLLLAGHLTLGCKGKGAGGDSKEGQKKAVPAARPSEKARTAQARPPAPAPEKKYPIKLASGLKAGQRYRLTFKGRGTWTDTLAHSGRVIRRRSNWGKIEYEAVVTVEKVGRHGQPLQEKHQVVKCMGSRRKRAWGEVLPRGTVFVAVLQKETINLKIKGHKLDKVHRALLMSANRISCTGPSADEIWGTSKPQPVGAEWPMDPKKAAACHGRGLKAVDFSGHAKLVEVKKRDGIEVLEIESKWNAKNLKFKFPKGFKQKELLLTMWSTVEVPLKPLPAWRHDYSVVKVKAVGQGTGGKTDVVLTDRREMTFTLNTRPLAR